MTQFVMPNVKHVCQQTSLRERTLPLWTLWQNWDSMKPIWNIVKNCIQKCDFFTNFHNYLEEKDLNDKFPFRIANISLQKQNFPGTRFPMSAFFPLMLLEDKRSIDPKWLNLLNTFHIWWYIAFFSTTMKQCQRKTFYKMRIEPGTVVECPHWLHLIECQRMMTIDGSKQLRSGTQLVFL